MAISPIFLLPIKRTGEIKIYKLDQDGIPLSLVLAIGDCEILRIDEKSTYYRGDLITDAEVGDAFREWLDLISVQRILDS
jgi:hypothetical protein